MSFLEGLGGSPANLDISVSTLTPFDDRERRHGLNVSGTSLTANRFEIQGERGLHFWQRLHQ